MNNGLNNITTSFNKPDLSDDQLEIAVHVAPKLRMLHVKRTQRASVTAFSIKNINIKTKSSIPHVLIVEKDMDIPETFETHVRHNGNEPRVVIVKNVCGFALGSDITDAISIKNYFIENVDSILLGNATLPGWGNRNTDDEKRLYQKVILVTGAAQGFGYGIAQHLALNGAYVVLADINLPKAEKAAKEFCELIKPFAGMAIQADVTDEISVNQCINKVVAFYGGIDILVSNAGILKAGSLEELSLKDFIRVTDVNYTAYFILTKYVSSIMKHQNEINPQYWMDIIQINSKSGLIGSNNNCAYAGSKFGGIGLTQSFALELAEYNIKVNSICPGNYLNGPLWSNPETGLFVQYLKTNKIKGAKTIEDLKTFYNNKVPMRRSCEVNDVTKAVMYVIEQEYETGQAFPVTGGQLMLR